MIVGALSTVFETLLNTSIQLRVAEAYRGRVMGFYGLTGGGLRELGGMQPVSWPNGAARRLPLKPEQ